MTARANRHNRRTWLNTTTPGLLADAARTLCRDTRGDRRRQAATVLALAAFLGGVSHRRRTGGVADDPGDAATGSRRIDPFTAACLAVQQQRTAHGIGYAPLLTAAARLPVAVMGTEAGMMVNECCRRVTADQLACAVRLIGVRNDAETNPAVCEVIRDVYGDPFVPTSRYRLDRFRTPDVVRVARTVRAECDTRELPVLRDALQDAGCDEPLLLAPLLGLQGVGGACPFCYGYGSRRTAYLKDDTPPGRAVWAAEGRPSPEFRDEDCDCPQLEISWRARSGGAPHPAMRIVALLADGDEEAA